MQFSNTNLPMHFTEFGIFIHSKFIQFLNDAFPIDVTKSGISILFKLIQFSNAFFPIQVTFFGIFIQNNISQSLKLLSSIYLIDSDNFIFFKFLQ